MRREKEPYRSPYEEMSCDSKFDFEAYLQRKKKKPVK